MDLTNLQTVLEETFSANFVSYYRSHVAHVNIVGRSFYQDHKLLQKIYEYFQDNIDTLAEKLRVIRATMPDCVSCVLETSPIGDYHTDGDSRELLQAVLDLMDPMIDQYHSLNEAAEEVNYIDIANFAQDQISQLAKHRWMLEATLETRSGDDDLDID